jgi:putative ABC transport system permease protein
MNIAHIALRNIFRNKWRSFLSLSAIALVTFTMTFLFAFFEGMKLDQQTTVVKFGTGQARIRNSGYEKYQFTNPEEFMIGDYDRVMATIVNTPAVEQAVGRLQFPGQIAVTWDTVNAGTSAEMKFVNQTVSVAVAGFDFREPGDFFSLAPYLDKDNHINSRLPGDGEILVADGFAKKFKLKPGDPLVLFAGTGSLELKVSGIVTLPLAQLNLKSVFLPLGVAQDLTGRDGKAEEILLRFKPDVKLADGVAAVRTALEGAGDKGLEVKSWEEIGTMGTYMDLVAKTFNIMALFFFILGTTVIINTTMMVIYERMREIGTLRAMGMTGREMTRLFFLEAFFISAAAAFIGMVIGAALILPLSAAGIDLGQFADLGKTDLAISQVIYPQLNLTSTLFVFIYSVAVSSLISFIPTRRAAKIEPVEALRSV